MSTDTQYAAERFSFEYDGLEHVGMLDYPGGEPSALVVLIPGHGRTRVVEGDQQKQLRTRLIEWGYAVALWDRAGCGESEGTYDHYQPVQDSAREAVAALGALRTAGTPGSDRIGLWSASRGGWIAPLAIGEDGEVDFWISVSGPNETENFPYLLRTNLELRGRSPERAQALADAWLESVRLQFDPSGSYEEYRAAAETVYDDPWLADYLDDSVLSRETFRERQRENRDADKQFHPDSGAEVVVPGFEDLLSDLAVPVFAAFGAKDTNVNWERTRDLYRRTLGESPGDLTVRVFEDCAHGIRRAETGAVDEEPGDVPPEFYRSMRTWLEETVEP